MSRSNGANEALAGCIVFILFWGALTVGSFFVTAFLVWALASLTGWYVFSWKLVAVVWIIIAILRGIFRGN